MLGEYPIEEISRDCFDFRGVPRNTSLRYLN